MITARKVASEAWGIAVTVGVWAMWVLGIISITVAAVVVPLAMFAQYVDPAAFDPPLPWLRLVVESVGVFFTGCVLVAIARLLSGSDKEEL